MTIRRPRYAMIKRTVNSLLEDRQIRSAPVPVESIAERSGISIHYGDLGDVSGLLMRRLHDTLIGVNLTQSPVRRRFTIAHEYGHYLLHEGLESHVDRGFRVNFRDSKSSEANDVVEIEANFFAANLLMPEEFLEADRADLAIDDDLAVKRLAKLYKVSQHAMSLRLGNVYGHLRPF
jgi:Zn-dependent peptidase ImmA (M78 family)